MPAPPDARAPCLVTLMSAGDLGVCEVACKLLACSGDPHLGRTGCFHTTVLPREFERRPARHLLGEHAVPWLMRRCTAAPPALCWLQSVAALSRCACAGVLARAGG